VSLRIPMSRDEKFLRFLTYVRNDKGKCSEHLFSRAMTLLPVISEPFGCAQDKLREKSFMTAVRVIAREYSDRSNLMSIGLQEIAALPAGARNDKEGIMTSRSA